MRTESRTYRFKQAFFWFLPTGIELSLYVFITGLTIVLSSLDQVKSALFVTGDLNPIRLGIESIDILLQNFVGERVAGSLSLAIFWGSVGLIVNLIWWLGSNFSTELSNDLVFSKYVHPKDTDPKSQLYAFIERTVLRTIIAIIGILFLNFFIQQGLPHTTTNYARVISEWNREKLFGLAIVTILLEILMLHFFVILARLILLKKQIFE